MNSKAIRAATERGELHDRIRALEAEVEWLLRVLASEPSLPDEGPDERTEDE